MEHDLGSLGPVRLPFQFGKPRSYTVLQLPGKTIVRRLEEVGWDSLGTPTEEFDDEA